MADQNLKPQAVRTEVDGAVVVGVATGQSVGANQGTPAASSSAWPTKITDGVDDATVVAAGDTATGQKGLVTIVAKSSTADPAPADGTLTFLSVDAATGGLRTKPSGTQTVSGTVTADTELPAAAALADAAANPTTPIAGAANLLYNGTTWDRARGDITNGLDVDVTRVGGTVTVDSELIEAANQAVAEGRVG